MAGDVVEQIRARLEIADIVSEKVVLKRAGKTLKGLCPFHVEKTPSFIVFPETGTWHCFGCGAGGDLFTFVMRTENLSFPEALARLAARAGVELHKEGAGRRNDDRSNALYEVNEAAVAYFQAMLTGPAGANARGYLRDRGVSDSSMEEFQLGFAPEGGAGLAHHLLQLGFDRSQVLEAGLAVEGDSGGIYDRFRGRLIFPIRDAAGKTVGFGGRGLTKESQPKYLNTSQTPLFDKGGILYAIDRARQEIRRTGQAVIVEGYMDALMAHQHGFRNVVAALGTAVTERQLGLVKRWAAEVCFALDPDEAGQEATARGLAVAMDALERTATPVPDWRGLVRYVHRLKTAIKIIALPAGKDPDEVIREDPHLWPELVRTAIPVEEFLLERIRRKHDLSTAEGKASAVDEAMSIIREIAEPIRQAHYVQRVASMVGVEEAILLQQVRRGWRRGLPGAASSRRATQEDDRVSDKRAQNSGADLESYCLALVLRRPDLLRTEPRLKAEYFIDPLHREIFQRVVQLCESGREEVSAARLRELLEDEVQGPLREELQQVTSMETEYPIRFQGPTEEAYRSAAVSLILDNLQLRKRQIEEAWKSREGDEDPEQVAALERAEYEIAMESHRLKLLGDTRPLRAIHKEVRHGG